MTNTKQAQRVVGYIRVSTAKQDISPEVQIDALMVAAELSGWDLTIVREEAASAKSMANRPVLADALADLKAKRFDALAVSKLDRISRSVHDFSGLLEQAGRQRWALICLDLGVDTTTITGAAMAQVTVTFAEMERKKIAERTRDGMARIKANDPTKHMGRRSVLPVATLDRIRELRATLSMAKTAERLNADAVPTATGRTWHASTIKAVESSTAFAARQ